MSTVTIVKKGGKIAIAADTLVKWSTEKNSAKYVVNHNKILKIGHNYIAVTGQTAGYNALKHYFSRREEVKLDNVNEIFDTWLTLHQSLKESYHLDTSGESEPGFEPMNISVLIANPYGIFAVGSYRDVQEFDKFYAYGSGNEYALGAMYASYDDNELDAEKIAKLGVSASIDFDDSTGSPITSYMFALKEKLPKQS